MIEPLISTVASTEAQGSEGTVQPTRQKRFARDIAYGLQQTLMCWATDFLDPPISAWYQKNFGKKGAGGGLDHTLGGEFVGDTAAFFTYVTAKQILGGPIDMVISGVKTAFDPTLTKLGRKAVRPWADAHDVSEDDPRFAKRVEEYKRFQAENAVDSTIIAVSATGLNVLAQRHLFGNKQTYRTILESKLLGAGLTLGAMSLTRLLLPNATKALDNELEDRFISKAIRWTHKKLGIQTQEPGKVILAHPEQQEANISHVITPEKRAGLLHFAAGHAVSHKVDVNDPQALEAHLAKQKEVYKALLKAFDENGYLTHVMAREHYEVIEKSNKECFDHREPAADKEASLASVQALTVEKRRDLEQFITLLDDPQFRSEVIEAARSNKIPDIKNKKLTDEERAHLSDGLLQAATGASNPAQAIFDKAELQQTEYRALAHSMEPDGVVTRVLANEMKKHLPGEDANDIDGIAKDYMEYYQKETLNVAQEFKSDSPTVQNAVERAQKLHAKYHTENSASVALAT